MPYNAEEEMKRRGALYKKALLPFIPPVVADGLGGVGFGFGMSPPE